MDQVVTAVFEDEHRIGYERLHHSTRGALDHRRRLADPHCFSEDSAAVPRHSSRLTGPPRPPEGNPAAKAAGTKRFP